MKKIPVLSWLFLSFSTAGFSQDHSFDPPWNQPPESKVNFTVPGIDNVPDLFGDITDPQLVVFFGGNQFMCIDDLLAGFKKEYPGYQRIFAETLPPGILSQQIEAGSVVIGNMRITQKPDIYTAEKNKIETMMPLFTDTIAYAFNKLAIMVGRGNPKHITGLKDLGRPDVNVSMPNPAWEGIGKQIQQAYVIAGGKTLKARVMEAKVKDSSTYLTQIHHRQTPMRIMYGQSDAGPVWYSEAFYQKLIGHPVDMIEIPEKENMNAVYMAASLKAAPHDQAARDFLRFLSGETAKSIYRKYGFTTR